MNNVQTINHIVGFYAVISSHHNQMFIENTRPYHNAIEFGIYFIPKFIGFLFFIHVLQIQFSQWWNVSFTLQKSIYYDYYYFRLALKFDGKKAHEKVEREKKELLKCFRTTHTHTYAWEYARLCVCVCACLGVKRMEFGKCLQNMFQIMKAPKGWKVDETVQT